MADRELTPEIARQMFGRPTPEQEPAELDALRAEAARRHGLPAAIAERLVGTTEAELDEDAQRLAPLVKPEPPEHVALARRAIEVAEQHDEDEAARRARRLYSQTGLGAATAKSEWARAFVERMHPAEGEADR